MVEVDLSVGAAAAAQQKQQEQSSVSDRVEQVVEGAEVAVETQGLVQPVIDGVCDAAQFVGDVAVSIVSGIFD